MVVNAADGPESGTPRLQAMFLRISRRSSASLSARRHTNAAKIIIIDFCIEYTE